MFAARPVVADRYGSAGAYSVQGCKSGRIMVASTAMAAAQPRNMILSAC